VEPGLYISLALVIATVSYASIVMRGNLRFWFIVMVLLISTYEIWPLSDTLDHAWLRHFPFYIGELCFMFVLGALDKLVRKSKTQPVPKQAIPKQLLHALQVTPISSGTYVLQQGLQHIFVIPIFFFVLVTGIVRDGMSDHIYRMFMGIWSIAMVFIVGEHLVEFCFESLEIGGAIRAHVEGLELACFWIGLTLLLISLRIFQVRKVER
jgi:hypothetical protein